MMNKKPINSYSPVIIGCMRLGQWGANFDTPQYEKFIDACLDLGINDFDHADIYGGYTTEKEFGNVIKKRKDLQSKIKITTKCTIKMPCEQNPIYNVKYYDSSPEAIIKSVDESLLNLGVENIELLLLHRPDALLNAQAVGECFSSLHKAGKVSYFGVSNFTTSQFNLLNNSYPLSNNQVEASLIHVDPFFDGTLDNSQVLDVKITAWSPLGGGKLFSESDDEQVIRVKKTATALLSKYNCDLSQLMLAWLAKHPSAIVPVLGTTKLKRISSAMDAVAIDLSYEDWYKLLEASRGHEVA